MAAQQKLIEKITMHKFLRHKLKVYLFLFQENTIKIIRHLEVSFGIHHYKLNTYNYLKCQDNDQTYKTH